MTAMEWAKSVQATIRDAKSGISMRMIKEWEIDPQQSVRTFDCWVPASWLYPLAGHQGDCAKVTRATVTGQTDTPCSCGASQ